MDDSEKSASADTSDGVRRGCFKYRGAAAALQLWLSKGEEEVVTVQPLVSLLF